MVRSVSGIAPTPLPSIDRLQRLEHRRQQLITELDRKTKYLEKMESDEIQYLYVCMYMLMVKTDFLYHMFMFIFFLRFAALKVVFILRCSQRSCLFPLYI